ncbi:hypothetical protein LPTSP4_14890 [Leptospira ryugenii]|uniref:HTH tetR-type domain-containing protein n=1 Tax=Leptospira ryugenii TaxID=1917863 RepID=A0A2P2DZB0_9LEPT|nr:TetR/AcrR family transcriptional regulator [Leptospira ryugenii]GBF49968.1 hypothetical protein LPTSP4_14890 [Leptospira ryugenii]
MINQISESKVRIMETAVGIANAEGWDSLSVKKIADQLSITSAALYKHFESFEDLKIHISLFCFQEISELLEEVTLLRANSSARLEYLALLLRKFAVKQPGLFQASLFRGEKEPKELASLRNRSQKLLQDLFRDYSIPEDRLLSVSRSYRALIFGILSLEIKKSFGLPEKPEVSFREAVSIFLAGLASKYPEGRIV